MHLEALLGLCTERNNRFLDLSYTSTIIPCPFIYLKPKIDTPFGLNLPVKSIIGSTPRLGHRKSGLIYNTMGADYH